VAVAYVADIVVKIQKRVAIIVIEILALAPNDF
jgi:hypothetical protein